MATVEERKLMLLFDRTPEYRKEPGSLPLDESEVFPLIDRLNNTANFSNLTYKIIKSTNPSLINKSLKIIEKLLIRAEDVKRGIDTRRIKEYIRIASEEGKNSTKEVLTDFLKDYRGIDLSIMKPANNLPPGWIAKVSRTTGMPYYVKDGVAQMNKPTAGGKYRTKRRKHKVKKTRTAKYRI